MPTFFAFASSIVLFSLPAAMLLMFHVPSLCFLFSHPSRFFFVSAQSVGLPSLLSLVLIKAKSLFRELCIDKVGWDEELPPEKREKWERWEKDLRDTKEISVPRELHPWSNDALEYSLHGSGDASAKAYCAVIYL